MGICTSAPDSVFDVEQTRIESILTKTQDELNDEEKEILEEYIKTYSSVIVRLQNVLNDIDKRLSGKDPEPAMEKEYTPSASERAYAKLSSVMKSLKREMTKYDKAINHYKQLAIKNRSNEDICKDYLKIVKRCQQAQISIDRRMNVIDEKLKTIQVADITLEQIVMLNEVAENLEQVQKSMGTLEQYETTMDNLKALDENLRDMNVILYDHIEKDDDVLDDYLSELDNELAKESGVNSLPQAPIKAPVVKECDVEKKQENRIVETE